MKIYDRITAELERQHIAISDLCNYVGIDKNKLENAETLSGGIIVKAAEFLGCSCDYIACLSDNGAPTLKDDKRIGFTPLERITKLFNLEDEPQQLELFDLICDYCRQHGVTYTRVQAEQEYEELSRDIIYSLDRLSRLQIKRAESRR